MNATLTTLALILCTASSALAQQTVYTPVKDPEIIFRGQSDGTYKDLPDSGAQGNGYDTSPGDFGGSGTPDGSFAPAPLGQDPFLGGGGGNGVPFSAPVDPYGQGGGYNQFSFGANSPQPYRMGWTQRYDSAYLFGANATGNPGVTGDLSIIEIDAAWEHTSRLSQGWIFSSTPEFGVRFWDGPMTTAGTPGLPGQVYRIGWDIELATASQGPWNLQLAFNPSINSDFHQSLSSDAINFDGRGILTYRVSPQWMWVGGVGYWDRVNDQIIPYGGAVWTPNDTWEFRLLFPKPRISLFLGNLLGGATWVYLSGEYHVESYEVNVEPLVGEDQIQIEDWRLMGGLRTDYGAYQAFIEGGWVFSRDVEYKNVSPGFKISDGAIIRAGLRF